MDPEKYHLCFPDENHLCYSLCSENMSVWQQITVGLMFMRTMSIGLNCSDGKQWLSNSFSEGNIVSINHQSLFLTYRLPLSSPLMPFLQMNYPITPMGNSSLWLASCETSNWSHICWFPKDMVFCNLLEWIIYIIFFPPSFHPVLFFSSPFISAYPPTSQTASHIASILSHFFFLLCSSFAMAETAIEKGKLIREGWGVNITVFILHQLH